MDLQVKLDALTRDLETEARRRDQAADEFEAKIRDTELQIQTTKARQQVFRRYSPLLPFPLLQNGTQLVRLRTEMTEINQNAKSALWPCQTPLTTPRFSSSPPPPQLFLSNLFFFVFS